MRYPEWTPHRPGVYEEAADGGVGFAAVGSRGAGASTVCEDEGGNELKPAPGSKRALEPLTGQFAVIIAFASQIQFDL